MTIDWGNAPEWATHHGYAGLGELRVWFNAEKYCRVRDGAVRSVFNFAAREGFTRGEIRNVTERPGAWEGLCLPPVGAFVEALIDHSWVSAEVLAHGVEGEDEVAVLQVGSRLKTKTFMGIRPVPAPEQLAAAEVDKAMAILPGEVRCKSAVSRAVQQLIDAGYRKP